MKRFIFLFAYLYIGVAGCVSATEELSGDEAIGEDNELFAESDILPSSDKEVHENNTLLDDGGSGYRDNDTNGMFEDTEIGIADKKENPEDDAFPTEIFEHGDEAISPDEGIDTDLYTPDEDVVCQTPVPDSWVLPIDDLLPPHQGKILVTLNGGFTDHFLFNADNYLKVGIREEWGASIVFFGIAANTASNVIDANDTGREVQVAFYDPARSMQGCAYNASCLEHPELICANSIRYLGWNPVQGGNRCNLGSPVESIEEQVGQIRATVRPLFWNPDWDKPSCDGDGCTNPMLKQRQSDVRYRQRLRFIHSHIVEIMMEVENLSDTPTGITLQEFPTLYAAYGAHGLPNLHKILDSNGTQIAVDIPANDGFFYKNFDTSGAWAALQNDTLDYGVGIYYENRITAYQAWQKEGVFNNIRSRFAFGIPAHGVVRARAYLMLGRFTTIQGLASWLDTILPPFGYLDTPTSDSTHSGSLILSGWVLDNKGVASLHVELVDGTGHIVAFSPLFLDTVRPDVCAVYPGYFMCNGPVGFSGSLSLAGFPSCSYLIQVYATDTDGNERIIARTRIILI